VQALTLVYLQKVQVSLEDKRLIQSDGDILTGDRGGPLLDSQGSVIGITVMGWAPRAWRA
jgi:S1-C subfamily serine protease